MSQRDRQLEQRLLRNGPDTQEKEMLLQRMRKKQERQEMLTEDLQVLREIFMLIEPKAVRVDIHSHLDQGDGCVVIRGVSVYDEHGHSLPCQDQDAGTWTELLSVEYLGVLLHCMYEADTCGDHQFHLKSKRGK